MRKATFALASVLALLAVSSRPAYAYIDPNSGSLFLQLLIAGTGGVFVLFRIFKDKIKNFFRRFRR